MFQVSASMGRVLHRVLTAGRRHRPTGTLHRLGFRLGPQSTGSGAKRSRRRTRRRYFRLFFKTPDGSNPMFSAWTLPDGRRLIEPVVLEL